MVSKFNVGRIKIGADDYLMYNTNTGRVLKADFEMVDTLLSVSNTDEILRRIQKKKMNTRVWSELLYDGSEEWNQIITPDIYVKTVQYVIDLKEVESLFEIEILLKNSIDSLWKYRKQTIHIKCCNLNSKLKTTNLFDKLKQVFFEFSKVKWYIEISDYYECMYLDVHYLKSNNIGVGVFYDKMTEHFIQKLSEHNIPFAILINSFSEEFVEWINKSIIKNYILFLKGRKPDDIQYKRLIPESSGAILKSQCEIPINNFIEQINSLKLLHRIIFHIDKNGFTIQSCNKIKTEPNISARKTCQNCVLTGCCSPTLFGMCEDTINSFENWLSATYKRVLCKRK